MQHGPVLRAWLDIIPSGSVVAGPRLFELALIVVLDVVVVDIGIAIAIDVIEGEIQQKGRAAPVAALVAFTVVPVAVGNAPVVADVLPPKAMVEPVAVLVVRPVWRRPKGTVIRSLHPRTGNPVISSRSVSPIPRRPHHIGLRGVRLLVNRQRRRRPVGVDRLLVGVHLGVILVGRRIVAALGVRIVIAVLLVLSILSGVLRILIAASIVGLAIRVPVVLRILLTVGVAVVLRALLVCGIAGLVAVAGLIAVIFAVPIAGLRLIAALVCRRGLVAALVRRLRLISRLRLRVGLVSVAFSLRATRASAAALIENTRGGSGICGRCSISGLAGVASLARSASLSGVRIAGCRECGNRSEVGRGRILPGCQRGSRSRICGSSRIRGLLLAAGDATSDGECKQRSDRKIQDAHNWTSREPSL